jgi:hypothetical protein
VKIATFIVRQRAIPALVTVRALARELAPGDAIVVRDQAFVDAARRLLPVELLARNWVNFITTRSSRYCRPSLALLHTCRHHSRQCRLALQAEFRFVLLDDVGIFYLAQRITLVSGLTPALLARNSTQAAGNPRLLLQTITRRRLAAVRTVGAQLAAKISDLLLEGDVLQSKPGILHPQFRNLTPRFAKLQPRRVKLLPYFGKLSPKPAYYRMKFGGHCHPGIDSYRRSRGATTPRRASW